MSYIVVESSFFFEKTLCALFILARNLHYISGRINSYSLRSRKCTFPVERKAESTLKTGKNRRKVKIEYEIATAARSAALAKSKEKSAMAKLAVAQL